MCSSVPMRGSISPCIQLMISVEEKPACHQRCSMYQKKKHSLEYSSGVYPKCAGCITYWNRRVYTGLITPEHVSEKSIIDWSSTDMIPERVSEKSEAVISTGNPFILLCT